LAHFIVSDDVERSRRFYTEVLGGRVAFSGPGGLTYVALSNSWIMINVGGGPTDDKPTVTLETPRDPDRVSRLPQYPRQRHRGRVRRMDRPWRSIPDVAETAPVRDPLLHPRSRRSFDRSGADHGSAGGLGARSLAREHARRGVGMNQGH
jgi:catechol 2,3-dioxygenase-like lactoylglutathione lyase family enzyme